MTYADAGVVFVVDDDPSVRSSLKVLIGSIGLQVESFYSANGLATNAARGTQLPGTGCQIRWDEWPRVSARACREKLPDADHLHHRLRRCSNECPGHEGWGGRIPLHTISRPGSA